MLSKNSKGVKRNSGSLTRAEHIRPKIVSSDLVSGDVFDSRPVDRFEESAFVQPVRNELLADGSRLSGTAEELGHASCERGLAAADIDSAPKRSNVVSFHKYAQYKRACMVVNKSARMTAYKAPCTVVPMRAARPKPAPAKRARKEEAEFDRGVDGRTANARFREAFETWRAAEAKTQMDLVRACNRIAGRPEKPEKDYVSQQIIDQIVGDDFDAAKSQFLDVLAEALDVRAVWLRLGVGDKRPERTLIERMREVLKTAS